MKDKKKRRRKSRYGPSPHIEPGVPPATLEAVPDSSFPAVSVLAYGPEGYVEEKVDNLAGFRERFAQWPVLWVHVSGLGHAGRINEIGEAFGIHPLTLEDIISGGHRPKVEDSGRYIFVVVQTASYDQRLKLEQLAILFTERIVLTFQEGPAEYLESLRERVRKGAARLMRSRADYLAYAIIDMAVDHLFPVLEKYGDDLEILEDQVIARPDGAILGRIHEVKRDLLTIRRSLWPLREVMSGLLSERVCIIADETRPFLRDCYDHVIQAIDLVAAYREVGAALSEIYLSSVSNRLNEVMKVLTIIATIFIPLTFIVGLYGMNFDPAVSPWNMPELKWPYGYPVILGLMTALAGLMLYYFKKKKWI
ncbi:MAG: magnesium/cobalt transporter CorA [Thermodesulfobacteriota bacterium]